jgi:hypothetical protein
MKLDTAPSMEIENVYNDVSKGDDSEDVNMEVSAEEEARQAIEMLRGDDVSERIAAANKIDSVAKILGDERTREVCCFSCNLVYIYLERI